MFDSEFKEGVLPCTECMLIIFVERPGFKCIPV